MDRASSKHSPRVDDQLAGEVREIVRGAGSARSQEWRLPEPSAEDKPRAGLAPDDEYGRGEPGGVGNPEAEEFSRFGSYIGRAFPGDRAAIEQSARDLEAPDDVFALIRQLPPDIEFQNTAEVWKALGR